ncbi:MAG: hypothetical protein HN370_03915 [Phycisphaerales bacterium]|jgi:hypothetical protein|nr:hypothetical protein [Phycisphaerales bacterium]
MKQTEQTTIQSARPAGLMVLVVMSMVLGVAAWEAARPSRADAAIPNPDALRGEMVTQLKAIRASQEATQTEVKALRTLLASGGVTVRVAEAATPSGTKSKK